MVESRLWRRAIAVSLTLGTAAAAVMSVAPAGAQPDSRKGYIEVPAGGAFTAGTYSVAPPDVAVTGDDTGFTVTLDPPAGEPFALTLTPRTGTTFGATNATETGTTATATTTNAAMTLTRTGSTCTNPTGEFTLDSATFGGTPLAVLTFALRFSIQCSEDSGTSASGFAYFDPNVTPFPSPLGTVQPGEYVPVPPTRLLDTRDGAQIGPAGTVDIDVTGNASTVPTTALAVVVNLTAVNPDTDTFLTLFPTGTTRGDVSNLNPRQTDSVANLSTVRVGTANQITLYNQVGSTDAVVDVVGYYAPDNAAAGGDRFVPQIPTRKLDTRVAPSTALAAGETRSVDLGVTSDAAMINVTVTNPTEGGYLTVFPDGATTVPLASNVNFVPTQTIANLAVVKLDAGRLKLYNPAGSVHVVIDLLGTYEVDAANADGAGRFVAVDPVRAYDSRNLPAVALGDMATRDVNLLLRTGKYPFEYQAVVANLTVANTTTDGYMTAFPASTVVPFASNLNWLAGEIRPNQIVAGTNEDGTTSFFNAAGSADFIVDVAGYFTQ